VGTGEQFEYQYRPEERINENIGTLFVDVSGLSLLPQRAIGTGKRNLR